ncbi:PP2C family protein-serine/threonine phosphatase [Butyrivibrio sp. INlla14]|uniref:PP2C family protein-serine/threonine phosphatase n=1 Tax=Butyrivibrio sp. INlla14 TaxID=1520808 RepID=UPI0008770DF3|nr:PP2C family protein-serine/threonine phosphatase [Butyrivibrio sp. INlla14]SCX97228.1 Stage II sporulation protein E (SpoIIE) [Butyrivibrio sp. INlla14]
MPKDAYFSKRQQNDEYKFSVEISEEMQNETLHENRMSQRVLGESGYSEEELTRENDMIASRLQDESLMGEISQEMRERLTAQDKTRLARNHAILLCNDKKLSKDSGLMESIKNSLKLLDDELRKPMANGPEEVFSKYESAIALMNQYENTKNPKPSEILRYLNDRMCEENSNTMFVTVWFGIMDITNGEVIAASAGHEYPFITDETGKFHMFKDPHGIMIGALEDQGYEDYTMTIPKGGKLFVYTDGVAEAQNKEEELFGLDRIGENLNKLVKQDPQSLIEGMHQAIDAFEEGAEQFDDITMLCIEFSGK